MDVPPQFQLLTALVIGVLVAVGAAYKFFRDLSSAPEQSTATAPLDQLRMLGAALGDSQALGEIADQLREIRILMQRHLDTDKTGDLVEVAKRIADQNERRLGQVLPPRRSH